MEGKKERGDGDRKLARHRDGTQRWEDREKRKERGGDRGRERVKERLQS